MGRRKHDEDAPAGAAWVAGAILACVAAAVVWQASPQVFGDGPVPIGRAVPTTTAQVPPAALNASSTEPVQVESVKIIAGTDERFFKLSDGKEWNVTLRQASGEPYTEVRLIGMAGDKTAIVSASAGRPMVLRVERSGSIRELYQLPLGAEIVGYGNGAVWLEIHETGEGLESEQVGPSRYGRLDLNGVFKQVAKEDVVY